MAFERKIDAQGPERVQVAYRVECIGSREVTRLLGPEAVICWGPDSVRQVDENRPAPVRGWNSHRPRTSHC